MNDPALIWSYLAQTPLFWLAATLVAYALAEAIFHASGRASWANPVLLTVVPLAALLIASGTSYQTYFDGAQFVHFMLGPATVCMGVALYDNLARIRRALLPILAALLVGSVVAIVSALGIARAFGLSDMILASMAPKSTTAPVAIGISEALGGQPTLTATMVIVTGMFGAVIATPLLNLTPIRDARARGFAVGVAAHGIGTARAYQISERAGAFASIGMGLNAILTAILAPLVLALF